MTKPTHEDAMIMLQVAQWGAATHLTEALNWMWSDEFVTDGEGFWAKYPFGSQGAQRLMTIGNHFETLGTLSKQGLFNETLLFDWLPRNSLRVPCQGTRPAGHGELSVTHGDAIATF